MLQADRFFVGPGCSRARRQPNAQVPGQSDTIQNMRRNRAYVIVAIILLTCVVCPALELFDHWDHTVQTGNDIEYNFVVLGLCIGLVYALARFALGFPLLKSATRLVSKLRAFKSVSSGRRAPFFFIPILLTPPILALRI
jgi:hypothetical protein